jgi:hypothetical protein
MRILKMRYFFLLLCVLSIGCDSDNSLSSRQTPNPNAFAGDWNLTFAGACPGEGQINIAANGLLSGNIGTPAGCEQLGGLHTLSGGVTGSGEVASGSINEGAGVSVGSIKGSFSGNSGSGVYQFMDGRSGTWSARKIS